MADNSPVSANPSLALKRVFAPRQARSRRTMARILDALLRLLERKPFDAITMAELARHAGVAVTSIYARFEDKRTLILAAHQHHRDATIRELDELLAPERWHDAAIGEIVKHLVVRTLAQRRRIRHLLRASLLADDPEVYQRAAEIIRAASEKLALLVAPRLSWIAAPEREAAVDFANRAVIALIQQRELFGAAEPGRFTLSERQFAARLITLFIAAIGVPSRANSQPVRATRRRTGNEAL